MVSHRIYPFIQIFILLAVGSGEEFRFPLSSDHLVSFSSHHWDHPTSNSALDINGIVIDIFQWRAAAESKRSINVDLVNPVWEYAGWIADEIVLPEAIEISEVLNFRGTPTIYFKVNPWRTVGNEVEVLTGGEIRIWVDPVDFPITFSHPYLLNGEKRMLQRTATDETEYLIICPNRFASAAQSLAELHTYLVSSEYQLNTEVIFSEDISSDISGIEIREYILSRINDDLEFLLLLGNETDVPPILFNNNYPSDDFYTTPEITSGDPQLITGRIPVSTVVDANSVVDKIYEYILNPTYGIWRSKIALVADDMYRSCSLDNGEKSHTEYSDNLFDLLNPLVPVLPFYGIHYSIQQTSSGCAYPDLTWNLIQTINNGVALINYIGHGDPETWAGEKLLNKSRDLPLIHSSENRLAIWVAGTCSFGNYYGQNSFMEDLLIKEDGAIAVIASTETVGYVENYNYIDRFFSEIYNDIVDSENTIQTRLGEMVWNAKNGDKKFHTFGDPALPLPFPKIGQNLVDNYPENINLVEEEIISFIESAEHSSILIRENEKDYIFYYETDSLIYTLPGSTYIQMDVSGNTTCFRIPLDAGSCNNCVVIQAYQEDTGWNGKIESIPNISIEGTTEDFEDMHGPIIRILQDNSSISDGSAIFPNIDLTVSLEDESGINLMETIGHGIRYAFDDDNLITIPGSEFIYTDCSAGFVKVPVPISFSEGEHQIYLEAWDGLNNKSSMEIYLDLLALIDEDQLLLSKVYPIPNPFSNNTHFTMISTHFPIDINIHIYSISGLKVQTLNKSINECDESYSENEGCFIKIGWDGRDEYGYKIVNGAYFYHVKAKTNNNLVFEDTYKLAKIE